MGTPVIAMGLSGLTAVSSVQKRLKLFSAADKDIYEAILCI